MTHVKRSRTKKKMEHFLPPTPCTEELRVRVEQTASGMGISMAELQRTAVEFFLSKNDTKCVNKDSLRVIRGEV